MVTKDGDLIRLRLKSVVYINRDFLLRIFVREYGDNVTVLTIVKEI